MFHTTQNQDLLDLLAEFDDSSDEDGYEPPDVYLVWSMDTHLTDMLNDVLCSTIS